MKTDKELLELAAKAAGVVVFYFFDSESVRPRVNSNVKWNPLIDDGDALRLAVKLNISFLIDDHTKKIESSYKESDCTTCFYEEDFGLDSLAATRRAIVRAAAAIGESK